MKISTKRYRIVIVVEAPETDGPFEDDDDFLDYLDLDAHLLRATGQVSIEEIDS